MIKTKKYSAARANDIITNDLIYYVEYFNTCLVDILTHAAVGKWEATIKVSMPDSAFNEIWHDTKWIGDNGDYLVLIKFGNGGWSSKKGNGYVPCQYVWDKLNKGIPIMGITDDNYIQNPHTFNLYKSPITKDTSLSMCFEKRHVHSECWITMKAPKNQL